MSGVGELYTCACCGTEHRKTVPDAEAWDEALDTLPAPDLAEGVEIVCDPCYRKIMEWARQNAPGLLRGDAR